MKNTISLTFGLLAFVGGMTVACGPEGSEPGEVLLPVVADSTGVTPCTNDLGWQVTLTEARVAVGDLEFTIEGETHTSIPASRHLLLAALQGLRRLLAPEAVAHPGHQAGGEVTGALGGRFVANLIEGGALGQGTLLPGEYHGMNLSFGVAAEADGLAASDPLVGHTAYLVGAAGKEGVTVAFRASLDVEDGLQMVGAPFVLTVGADTAATLGLTLYTIDPSEDDTLFDGLDFGALDEDADGQVDLVAGQAGHNILYKTLIRHDHWGIVVK